MIPFFIIFSVFLIVVAIIAVYLKSPQHKGSKGERATARELGKDIPDEKYIINDLILPTKNGSTTQIDHIVINKFGVWVIETKNYAGTIYGEANQTYWTQVLSYGKVKNKFYSPVKQNASHAYHISALIGTPARVHSLVVFTGNADLSHVNAPNVCYLHELTKEINTETGIRLSAEEMCNYRDIIIAAQCGDTVTGREHIKNIHKTKRNIEQGICPRCGGNLVLRNGKYGDFFGCSNYPECTFKKPLGN